MSLKTKLTLILVASALLVIGSLTSFILLKSAQIERETQEAMALARARKHAETVKAFFDTKLIQLKDISLRFEEIRSESDAEKERRVEFALSSLAKQDGISGVYVSFEAGEFMSKEATQPGNFYSFDAYSEDGEIEIEIDADGDLGSDALWYNVPKNTLKAQLIEPYKYAPNDTTEVKYMISISLPLIFDGKFVGVIGADMTLDDLQKYIFEFMTDGKSGDYAFFVSNGGLCAASPDPKNYLSKIGSDMEQAEQTTIQEKIRSGENYQVENIASSTGEVSLITYSPVLMSESDKAWSIGYVIPLASLQYAEKELRNNIIIISVLAVVVWGFLLYVLFSHTFKPFTRTTKLLEEIAEGDGDLTVRLEVNGKDEIAQQARSFNALMDKLHLTVSTAQKGTRDLLTAIEKLYKLSISLKDMASATQEESSRVASTTEQVNENVQHIAESADKASHNAQEVAGAAEEMSVNISTIVSSIDEMSSSIGQIASNAGEAKKIVGEAILKAQDATNAMGTLGAAAKEIGQVTDVIKKIADKTNLLALNATIEAASAGEAGKGFSVVANEIKELANQSAKSADDIAAKIEGIQSGTENAVGVINSVSDIIVQINKSVEAIAGHVEQQTKASNEIASNVGQSNIGAKRIAGAISEVAKEADDVSKNALEIEQGAREVSSSVEVVKKDSDKSVFDAKELEETANNLKEMSVELDMIMRHFKT